MKDITGVKVSGTLLTARSFTRKEKEVLEGSGYIQYNYFWLFECDCGTFIELPRHLVVSKRTKSCGCLASKSAKAREQRKRENRQKGQHEHDSTL